MLDVIVIGAGTAGAAAAAFCAEGGLRVRCLDRLQVAEAGARWVNDVPAAALDAAGVAHPTPEELGGPHVPGAAFHMVAGWDGARATAHVPESYEIDMRALVRRLQHRAREAGATFRGDAHVTGVEVRTDGRATVHLRDGEHVEGDIVIVAAGVAGIAGADLNPPVPRDDLCVAAQAVFDVSDAAGMEAFYEDNRAKPGDALCFTAIAGGYSIVRVIADADTVSVLTGSVPAAGHPDGGTLLERFVAAHAWIGSRQYGGQRAIPIRRPHATLNRGPVALLGDSACQVFPAHGSGIGVGLVAARALADALRLGRGTAGYATTWSRTHGGLLAAYDLFRRLSQSLSIAEVDRLVRAGLIDDESLAAGLRQTLPTPTPRQLVQQVRGLASVGPLALRMGGVLAKMPAVMALYRRYPADPESHAAMRRWTWAANTLLG